MNNSWQAFEEKRKKLHRKYTKLKWRARAIWLIYNAIANFLIFFLLTGKSFPFAVFICFFSTVLSTVYLIKAIMGLNKIEAEQDRLLMNDAPLGRLKL